ncbi:putative membrane protein [Desulfonatronum thiosulfatophilum]|uniref:Putative membrane protein n=1 Tax=Desulfonatronum thiosulfatophilum TaxID=617002 RepID=A0A1G6CIK1_9BACT|nr:LapA family protein [Desulfonatronum thiosulfatophilum]SDB32719.1 putative membrane protein [Desulfonatronum thiosulfatophilum]
MRYLKVLLLILFFFVSMLFFIQNNEVLSEELVLQLELFDWHVASRELPFYLVVLLSFVAGSLFSLAYFIGEKIRLSRELKAANNKRAALEQEVTSLRNLPLEEETYPTAPQKTVAAKEAEKTPTTPPKTVTAKEEVQPPTIFAKTVAEKEKGASSPEEKKREENT